MTTHEITVLTEQILPLLTLAAQGIVLSPGNATGPGRQHQQRLNNTMVAAGPVLLPSGPLLHPVYMGAVVIGPLHAWHLQQLADAINRATERGELTHGCMLPPSSLAMMPTEDGLSRTLLMFYSYSNSSSRTDLPDADWFMDEGALPAMTLPPVDPLTSQLQRWPVPMAERLKAYRARLADAEFGDALPALASLPPFFSYKGGQWRYRFRLILRPDGLRGAELSYELVSASAGVVFDHAECWHNPYDRTPQGSRALWQRTGLDTDHGLRWAIEELHAFLDTLPSELVNFW